MKEKIPVRVRIANESYYTTIKLNKETFRPVNEFKTEVFGWVDDIMVAMKIEDYKELNEVFQEKEKWDLTVIDEKGNDLIVMAPNGDTQYMTKYEYETRKNRK